MKLKKLWWVEELELHSLLSIIPYLIAYKSTTFSVAPFKGNCRNYFRVWENDNLKGENWSQQLSQDTVGTRQSQTHSIKGWKRGLSWILRGAQLLGGVAGGKSNCRVTAKNHCRILKIRVAKRRGVGGHWGARKRGDKYCSVLMWPFVTGDGVCAKPAEIAKLLQESCAAPFSDTGYTQDSLWLLQMTLWE